MRNRWNDRDAAAIAGQCGEACPPALAARVYSARLIGQEPALVLHGGGNVSVKSTLRDILGETLDIVCVKGSGWDLASIEPRGLPALDLQRLRRLRAVDAMSDEVMANQFRLHLLDASAPTPSIETLLHAFLPHAFVDHSHADAVLALTNQPDGEKWIREALGDRIACLPYVTPGFELSKAVAELHERNPRAEGIVLIQHGLITYGDTAQASYERHVELVSACEAFIERRVAGRRPVISYRGPESPAALAALAAPLLRQALATPSDSEDDPHVRSIVEWRAADEMLAFVNSDGAAALARTGPLTTDHLIRTKAQPLFIEAPRWDDAAALRAQLSAATEAYRADYRAYVELHGGNAEGLDASPRVVLVPGAGAFCWGRTKRDARIAADITEHALRTKALANWIERYSALSDDHLYVMEYRGLQQAKLGKPTGQPLDGRVVMVSGAGGAIGAAIAETCARAGAHVVLADLVTQRLPAIVERIENACGAGSAAWIQMDVTSEESVRAGYDEACRRFGGVDVVVPNAGIAHVAPLDELTLSDFQRVMNVNVVGYMLFMREGIRLLKRQGLGGHVVVCSSKNVLGPGKDFGAYSASKAAGHQLGRIAAIECAPHNIRVNMITPDAVFGDKSVPSGLWQTVGPDRARSRGMSLDDLPEYYRQRNLLKARVYGYHVGNAVVFFASNQTPTTGAVLPVDGGVAEAFPR